MISENIMGQRYQQLIDILAKRCNRFAFVKNRQLMDNEELKERFKINGRRQPLAKIRHLFIIFY